MSDDRVKMECPHCGYRSFPQWLNDEAHCLKCQAVLRTRGSAAAVNESRRAPGEVSTHKQAPSSAMESQSGICSASPDGVHHWKFGKCQYCQVSEGRLVSGAGVMANPGGAEECEKGGKCMFKFAKCTKCGRVEGATASSPAPKRSAASSARRSSGSELGDKVTEVFRRFDRNGDGTMDKDELRQILEQLHQGEFTDAQVDLVLHEADINGDGKVDYEEWAAWVAHAAEGADALRMGAAARSGRPSAKSAAAPRSAAAPSAASPGGGGDVQIGVQDAFHSYCGGSPDMDGKTFIKMCKDVGLVDRKFTPTDVDLIFAKVVTKGQRRIDFHQFQNAIRLIAEKKGIDSVESIIAGSGGPILHGTQADAVRFHDDKSTYTGVHVNGGPESVAKGGGTAADQSWKRT